MICLEQVKAVAEEIGIGFLGIGFQPKWGLKDIPIMPKVILHIILGSRQHFMYIPANNELNVICPCFSL